MAASSLQLAVTTFPEAPYGTPQESAPASPAQIQPPSDAVEVSVSKPDDSQDPGVSAAETRRTAQKLAEQLQSSLNSQTTLKFEVRLNEKGLEAGSLSDFRFQIVDKDTGRVVRQFPTSEMLNVTQQPIGLLLDASA